MPAVSRVKTYTKTRKTEPKCNYNYSSSGQNSFLFPITGASTAIDSLLAKNIEKRNSSIKESTKSTKPNKPKTRNGKNIPKEARLLENDSFDLSINTTFEKLLKAPVFQSVNYCNISLMSVNSTGEKSPEKENNAKPIFKVQKTYNRKVKTNALSLGKKIKNTKTNKKNLLQLAKKVQKTPDSSPDIYVARKFTPIASTSKLITPKFNSNTIFQPGLRHCMQAQNSPNFLASTPLLPRHLRSCHDFSISPITAKKQLNFKSGWKSLFESDSLPSTSIKDSIVTTVPDSQDEKYFLRNNSLVRNDLKFRAIPIVIIEDGLQLKNHTKCKRKLTDELVADVKKVYSPRVDLTRNSFSKYTKKLDKLFQSPYIDLTRCSFTEYLNKKKSNSECKQLSVNEKQDEIPISVNDSASNKMKLRPRPRKVKDKKQNKINVRGIGLRTRSHNVKNVSKTPRKARTMSLKTKPSVNTKDITESSPDKPTRRLRSASVHLNETSFSNDSNNSVFINEAEPSPKVENNEKTKRVLRKRSKSIDHSSNRLSNIVEKSLNDRKINKIKSDESIYIANIIEKMKKPLNISNIAVSNPVRRSSRTRRKSVLIDEENYSDWGEFQRITQNKLLNTSPTKSIIKSTENIENTVITVKSPSPVRSPAKRETRSVSCYMVNESNANSIINITDSSDKSLFSTTSPSRNNVDVIENTLHETTNPGKFITTRRGSSKELTDENFVTRRRKSSDVDLNHQTISLHEWERFSQSNISTVKIDDVESLQINEIVDNSTKNNNSVKSNNSVISDTFVEESSQNIFLKPGKQWLRSLSILRRTNVHNIDLNNSIKGRKWRDSVCAIFDQQDKQSAGVTGAIGARVTGVGVTGSRVIGARVTGARITGARIKEGGVLIDTSDNQHNEIYNITKNQQISRINSLNRRTTLQIVPISIATKRKEVSVCRNAVSILEDTETNKTGYVSTLADESQSILASFDKLSLTTNVEEREETARQIILKRCGQTAPLLFDDCYSQRLLTRCRKIGEGVYGEVFMYKSLDRQCRVMKVIPIEGNLVVNGEHQKKFEEIISEIIIASELSNLRNNKEFSTNGFNELLKICCVQGKYPQHLLDLWNLYDEEQGSENDSPEIFTDDQLYIVMELANGGQDLEAYRFNNAEQSFAVFSQVVCSLAVAESALQFEHRDMHWGNILISPTDETTTSFRLNGRELEIATKGVNVSIIDFTLSRMTYNNCCIFNDLALDPDLFTATGDYQFDIYRLMRQRNQDDWQRFEPYSNILWLDYTLEKMITQLRYLRVNTKTHKTNIRRLTQMRKKIFNYNSATELLNSDAFSQVFLY